MAADRRAPGVMALSCAVSAAIARLARRDDRKGRAALIGLPRVKRRSAPVLSLGQGGALRVVSSLPPRSRGMARRQGAVIQDRLDRPGERVSPGRARIAGP